MANQGKRRRPPARSRWPWIDSNGFPTGNADAGNPDGKRGWQVVRVTPVLTLFLQGLGRSAAAEMIELLGLQQQLVPQWHQWQEGTIDQPSLRRCCRPIRQSFEALPQRLVDLGCQRGEQTPWAKRLRSCLPLLQVADGLRSFPGGPGGGAY
jgi:hypothetical protein